MARGACVAVLAGNRADAWCAVAAAQGLGMRTTPLHPKWGEAVTAVVVPRPVAELPADELIALVKER